MVDCGSSSSLKVSKCDYAYVLCDSSCETNRSEIIEDDRGAI